LLKGLEKEKDMTKFIELKDKYRKQAEELVSKMTIEEVASQLKYDAPSIERLGVDYYNWWNEGLHGLARGGTATVFPQAIGLASMFDEKMLFDIAEVISTEARAKYNESTRLGDHDIYKGITLWSPNINIFRDPRWGRGQETYGEDPYLTSELGLAFINGLQGDGEHMKVAACAKHFAVHSGPEQGRHEFDAIATPKDLEETYLPAFEVAVKEGNVETVMGAYNRMNGEPCCGSEYLLAKTLRGKWGFDGHVVSDCWAIRDFHENHMVTKTATESAALALNNGCDLNCGCVYLQLLNALEEGLITEEQLRESAIRLFTTRAKLGMLDKKTEYDELGLFDVETEDSKDLSYLASVNSQVLLKNDGILPLNLEKYDTIGVIGPTASSVDVLYGNYNGTASETVTNIEGIRRVVDGEARILYSEGSHLYRDRVQFLGQPGDRLSEAVAVAKKSDVVIMCLGLDASIEGEEGDTGNAFAAGDKLNLYLPECQRELYEKVAEVGKPIVLVINTGSAMDVSNEAKSANAIIQSWYSGAFGGLALADVIFGNVSPSGKLPVTVSYDGTLPEFTNYSMKGRTYRYLKGEALYPFGYGLSYADFKYDNLKVSDVSERDDLSVDISVSVNVTNDGDFDGDEIVEVYINNNIDEKVYNGKNDDYTSNIDVDNQPKYSLCGFKRVSIDAGENKNVELKLSKKAFTTVLENGERVLLKGKYKLYVGTSQPDERSVKLTGKKPLEVEVEIS